MAVTKKTGKASSQGKQKIIVMAIYPETAGLTKKELTALENALRVAGEEFVKSHASLETVVAITGEGHLGA